MSPSELTGLLFGGSTATATGNNISDRGRGRTADRALRDRLAHLDTSVDLLVVIR